MDCARARACVRALSSPRLPKAFMPLAPHGDGRRGGLFGLGYQLDSFVYGGDGVEACLGLGSSSRLEKDERVGGILLAQRPRFGTVVVIRGRGPEEAGGRGGFETERRGFVGLEEGEEVRREFEELVACAARGVVKRDANCGGLA